MRFYKKKGGPLFTKQIEMDKSGVRHLSRRRLAMVSVEKKGQVHFLKGGRMSTRQKDEIIEILQKLKDKIKQKYKAKIKGIFGSYVKGEQKETSDVDILVNFDEGATLFDFVGLADYLEGILNLKVDIVPVDTIREELKEDVMKEAIYL